jgi:hypothetical protein
MMSKSLAEFFKSFRHEARKSGGIQMKKILFITLVFLAACSSPTTTTTTPTTTTGTPPVITPPVVKPPADPTQIGKQQTERLRGAWAHTFTLGSTVFTDKHELTSAVTESTSTPGDYLILGKSQGGAGTGGGYSNKNKTFLVLTLHPTLSFDDAYVFDLDSSGTIASGCYFFYRHTGDLGNCYELAGKKITSLNSVSSTTQRLGISALAVRFQGLRDALQGIR